MADQQEQPAYGRLHLLGKGEQEAHVTPQFICSRGFSHATCIHLLSSTEISSNTKYTLQPAAPMPPSERQRILLFYYQGAVTNKCCENLALKQHREQKLALKQLDVWACFPLFHPDILSSKKAGETAELETPLGGAETWLPGVCSGCCGAASPCSRTGSVAGEKTDTSRAC